MQYQELEDSAFTPFEGALPVHFCLSSVQYTAIYIIFLLFPPACSESGFGLARGCKLLF